MVELYRQGISINDDNYPAPDNVPQQGDNTTRTGNWRREGIICPRKTGNLQNSFASFRHYSPDAILRMPLLQLFLVIFPYDYIEEVLIPETNKGLSVPMDLQDKEDILFTLLGNMDVSLCSVELFVQENRNG